MCCPLQYARGWSARRATRLIPRPSISTANSLAGLAAAASKRRRAAGRRWRSNLRWPSAAFCDFHAYARRRGTAFGAGLWLSAAAAGHHSLSYLGLAQHGAHPISSATCPSPSQPILARRFVYSFIFNYLKPNYFKREKFFVIIFNCLLVFNTYPN